MKRSLSVWLAWKLRMWLGIAELDAEYQSLQSEVRHLGRSIATVELALHNVSQIAADVNIHGESLIIVITRLKGGRVKLIQTEFGSIDRYESCVTEVERRFGTRHLIDDLPMGIRKSRRPL